ncbi:MFS transporter [Enterobacter cloacae subsp. cloacae]|nr:MFS transporter [Enterobacter cloacae subsp. cloacae]
MGFFSMGCIFIGVFMMPGAVRRFGKKKSISAADGLGGGRFAQLLLRRRLGELCGVLLPRPSSARVVISLNWALVSDTVEYGEWRTGVRSEGTVYNGLYLLQKGISALAGSFSRGSCSRNWLCAQRGAIRRNG